MNPNSARSGRPAGALFRERCTNPLEVMMTSELLNLAIEAHGGFSQWKKLRWIKASASITGAIWYLKGKGDVLKDITIESSTTTERLTMDFPGQNRRSIFTPQRIEIQTSDGRPLQSRDNPRIAFAAQRRETPWDDIDVAYFSGEALWTYLNTPFLYTFDGFSSVEIDPIRVDGEIWRRLRVTFPDYIKSHTREQISCFGPDGLLRRHDYTVDILGGATGLNFASDYRNIDGIIIPTKRRVYAYDGDYQIVKEPLLVAIDMHELSVA